MATLQTTKKYDDPGLKNEIQPEIDEQFLKLFEVELPVEDGIPLETNWHRIQMNLLIDSIHYHWRDRNDYFAGGNMFMYFGLEQVLHKDYRGPDFFVVKDVDGTRDRDSWIVWKEEGRYPNVIVELASPSTIDRDLGAKKHLYAATFRTPEYFCYDPHNDRLVGWQLIQDMYQELQPNEQGWLWSQQLDVWIGTWLGEFQRVTATWVRFYTPDGQLVPTRTEAAEAENLRLRELLAEHGISAARK